MRLLRRLWHSATIMAWGSMAVRLFGLLLLLPLVLHRFSPADTALWLLFSSIANLQVLIDIGFSQTFARSIACAEGGAGVADLRDLRTYVPRHHDDAHVRHTMLRLVGTMRYVYLRLAALGCVGMVLAVFALARPINATARPDLGWVAAACVLLVSVLSLWGNTYSAYLQGRDRIALLRRWEMFFSIGGIGSASTVLLCGGGLLQVVVAQQAWLVLTVLRNRWLCRRDEIFRLGWQRETDRDVLEAIWPSAWRSGLGVLMGAGLVQVSGVAYAQIGKSVETSAYLLSLRMIQAVSQFSQAPFYNKLPSMARLRAQGQLQEKMRLAAQGFTLAHWVFMAGFVLLGVSGPALLRLIHSGTPFVSPLMWTLLGLAFLLERLGAMHIQLYSTTNHIIWHVANGWTGAAMVVLCVLLFPLVGVYAFPVSMAVSYGAVYCPIAMKHSYRLVGGFMFDVRTGMKPIVGLGSVWVVIMLLKRFV